MKRRQKADKREREKELEEIVDGALERQAQRAPISTVGYRQAE